MAAAAMPPEYASRRARTYAWVRPALGKASSLIVRDVRVMRHRTCRSAARIAGAFGARADASRVCCLVYAACGGLRFGRYHRGRCDDGTSRGLCARYLQAPQTSGRAQPVDARHKKTAVSSGFFDLSPCKQGVSGAQKRTRTSTTLRSPAPEAGASTNSAIWARGRAAPLGEAVGACQHALCASLRVLSKNSLTLGTRT